MLSVLPRFVVLEMINDMANVEDQHLQPQFHRIYIHRYENVRWGPRRAQAAPRPRPGRAPRQDVWNTLCGFSGLFTSLNMDTECIMDALRTPLKCVHVYVSSEKDSYVKIMSLLSRLCESMCSLGCESGVKRTWSAVRVSGTVM